MAIGLPKQHIQTLRNIFAQYPSIEQVILFGSRARHTHHKASDVDLALKGNVPHHLALQVKDSLEQETNIPFFFDVVVYENLNNDELRRHINREGVVMYTKGWQEVKLKDVADIIGGFAFKGADFGDEGDFVVKINNINSLYIKLKNEQKVNIAKYDRVKMAKFLLKKGDFVIAMTGATIEKVGKIIENRIAYVNQRVGKIVTKYQNDSFFIYYNLVQQEFRKFIKQHVDSSSAQENISASSISLYTINLPPLPEQKAIAEVLCSIDDKIDLLHRQNETLEAMAEALFGEWFVKQKNKQWKTANISTVLQVVLGGTPSTKINEYWDGDIPWINSGKINEFRVADSTSNITQLGLKRSNTKLLPVGSTVIAITGTTLGQVSLLEIATCANQSVIGIIPDKRIPKEFLFLWMKRNIKKIITNATGAAQSHINKHDVDKAEIIIPDSNSLKKITTFFSPLFKKIRQNIFHIQTLTQLRDTLLPKLIAGKVRVSTIS